MLLYQIALTLIPKIGDKSARKLLNHYPNAQDIFSASSRDLKEIGFTQTAITAIKNADVLKEAEDELNFIEKHKIKTLFYSDENYPHRLRFCDDAPVLLYYRGDVNFDHTKIISVVGTRMATEYGKYICKKIIEELSAEIDIIVVSGLAHGIDTQAHTVAVENNIPTIGVVAHGLDTIYPKINAKLASKMLENGSVLTEFKSKTIPDRENFPKRNRIIAGLCDAVLVVEAAKKGGALITADIANSYGREVFAVPGRVGDTFSEGCNNLIFSNKAILSQSAEDVLLAMNWKPKKKKTKQLKLFTDLDEMELKIVNYLQKNNPSDIDSLILNNDISATQAASVLLNLELKNIINCLPGKRYSLA